MANDEEKLSSEFILKAQDKQERSIALKSKQWEHILLKRPWMRDHLDKIRRTVEEPETILRGTEGELMSIKSFHDLLGGSSLVVVFRTEDGKGFIITVFPTKRVERLYRSREVIWRRKK